MLNRFSEIGSEFWIDTSPKELLSQRDGVYALSGRTAIDLIIQDILSNRHVRNVYMPAWCCDSMLAPFIRRNFQIHFYDIRYSGKLEYVIDDTLSTDIFYLTNYFGYENTIPLDQIRRIKSRGAIIIYDHTHSFLMSDNVYINFVDYSFASIRKWMGIVAGAIVNGITTHKLIECPYVNYKADAMRDKFRFLNGENILKEEFLEAFGSFNRLLSNDYCNYGMDDLSYTIYKQEDLKKIRQVRKDNASYLHDNLPELLFLDRLTEDAVPLFVPVIFDNKTQRDTVREKLIDNQIYCPVHWPKSVLVPQEYAVNDLYERELSLICDQRYGLKEMQFQVETIKQSI